MTRLLPPFPAGWYALALSHELPPGSLRTQKFMNQEIILFRTHSGVASAMDAYCPHLGAHMGYGGQVVGECVQCPFHGFRFDAGGNCTYTPYGGKLPPKAIARTYPICEIHGLLLAYFDPQGRAPLWAVPDLDMHGWSPLLVRTWDLRGHPQETSENSVDTGHLAVIHGYQSVEILKELVTDGPYLNVKYAMLRPRGLFGRPIRAEFEIHMYGLGYSLVDVVVPQFGLHTRHFVLATPTDGENIHLRVALSMQTGSSPRLIHPLLVLLPRRFLNRLLARAAFDGFVHDVQQDFVIWQHKRYIQPPILAQGDGPVGKYRQWARQFYRDADLALI